LNHTREKVLGGSGRPEDVLQKCKARESAAKNYFAKKEGERREKTEKGHNSRGDHLNGPWGSKKKKTWKKGRGNRGMKHRTPQWHMTPYLSRDGSIGGEISISPHPPHFRTVL